MTATATATDILRQVTFIPVDEALSRLAGRMSPAAPYLNRRIEELTLAARPIHSNDGKVAAVWPNGAVVVLRASEAAAFIALRGEVLPGWWPAAKPSARKLCDVVEALEVGYAAFVEAAAGKYPGQLADAAEADCLATIRGHR